MRALRLWAGMLVLVLAATACHASTSSQPPASPSSRTSPSSSTSSSTSPPSSSPPSSGTSPTGSPLPSPSATAPCAPSSGTLLGGLLVLKTVSTEVVGHAVSISFVFTSVGSASVEPASFTVAPAQPPFTEDASGRTLVVAGSKFLSVRLRGAYGYDPVNTPPRATYTGPTDFTAVVGPVAEIRRTGDFEGVLSWVVGLTRAACPHTTTLASPPTLKVVVPQ